MSLIISVTGPTGSGKSSICQALSKSNEFFTHYEFDWHYDDLVWHNEIDETHFDALRKEWVKNGSPASEAFYCEKMISNLTQLKLNKDIFVEKISKIVTPTKYILFENFFGKMDRNLRGIIDISVVIDTPLDICLARRLLRDKNIQIDIPNEYIKHSMHFFYQSCQRTKQFSEIILNGFISENTNAKILAAAIEALNVSLAE